MAKRHATKKQSSSIQSIPYLLFVFQTSVAQKSSCIWGITRCKYGWKRSANSQQGPFGKMRQPEISTCFNQKVKPDYGNLTYIYIYIYIYIVVGNGPFILWFPMVSLQKAQIVSPTARNKNSCQTRNEWSMFIAFYCARPSYSRGRACKAQSQRKHVMKKRFSKSVCNTVTNIPEARAKVFFPKNCCPPHSSLHLPNIHHQHLLCPLHHLHLLHHLL